MDARAALKPATTSNPCLSKVLLEELFPPQLIDRRRWPRRECAPVRVFVSDTEPGGRLWQGCVLDASQGGLGLKLVGPIPATGSVLRVSRCSVPALEASVQVRVAHARQEQNCCVIGCEFLERPAPSVLVLFS